MTVQDLYAEMRETAKSDMSVWNSLDYATGYYDAATGSDGMYKTWHELPESVQAVAHERMTPWVERYNGKA